MISTFFGKTPVVKHIKEGTYFIHLKSEDLLLQDCIFPVNLAEDDSSQLRWCSTIISKRLCVVCVCDHPHVFGILIWKWRKAINDWIISLQEISWKMPLRDEIIRTLPLIELQKCKAMFQKNMDLIGWCWKTYVAKKFRRRLQEVELIK